MKKNNKSRMKLYRSLNQFNPVEIIELRNEIEHELQQEMKRKSKNEEKVGMCFTLIDLLSAWRSLLDDQKDYFKKVSVELLVEQKTEES